MVKQPLRFPLVGRKDILGFMSARTAKFLGYFGLFGFLGLFSYGNQLLYRYLVPPGGDAINHVAIVDRILSGQYAQVLHYHLAWHAIVALITRISGVESITVMAWLGPMLLVVGGITLFYFNKRYFGVVAGLVSLVLISFLSRQPLQTFSDGGFPNVLAVMIVLPLAMIALERISTVTNKPGATLIFILAMAGLFLSHHLTTLVAIPVMAAYVVVQVMLALDRTRLSKAVILLIPIAFYLLFAIGAFIVLPLLGETTIGDLARNFVAVDGSWPFIHLIGQLANPNAIIDLPSYPNAIGEAVVYLGTIGVLVAAYYFVKESNSPRGRISLLLLIWLTFLLFGSQTPALGFPVRLMRDLAVPLALLGGVLAQAVYNVITARKIPTIFAVVIILLGLTNGYLTLVDRVKAIGAPNPLVYHRAEDQKMSLWITQNLPPNRIIGVMADDPYLPIFIDNQNVWVMPEEVKLRVTDPGNLSEVAPEADYIYIRYWKYRPITWDNVKSLPLGYEKSRHTQLVHREAGDDLTVYLFKVNKTEPSTKNENRD